MELKNNQSLWQEILERIDWGLLGLVTAITALGIFNLSSASRASEGISFHWAQSVWFLLGSGVVTVVCLLDYRVFERWAYVLYGLVVLLLAAVLVVGTELNGSQRWLDFGFFLVQPSELLKVGVVLVTARYFQDRNREEPYALKDLLLPFGLIGLGVFLVLEQPDLGTALVVLAIFMTMVLFEGVRLRGLVVLGLAGLIALPIGWTFGMKPYQKERVRSFLQLEDSEYGASWQVRQSMIAFGSGQFWGKGYGQGTQTQEGFVPEHESDFIAANWGEERGFAGMALLLVLYAALILRVLYVSQTARDRFGVHVGIGVAALLFWHVTLNLAMVTGLLPVAGLTLPLLSYGGSSLLTTLAALGLLLNISIRRRPLST
jgi:rod shape determining protein RodA